MLKFRRLAVLAPSGVLVGALWSVGGRAQAMPPPNGCSIPKRVDHLSRSGAARCAGTGESVVAELPGTKDQFLARLQGDLTKPDVHSGIGRALQRSELAAGLDLRNETDIRGRTAGEDYEKYIARPVARALKSIVLPVRFDRPTTLNDPALQKQSKERYSALTQYWKVVPAMMQNRGIWPAFLARNGMRPGTPHGQRVRTAKAVLLGELSTTAPNPMWRTLAISLRDAYVAERKRIVIDRGKNVTVRLLPRTGSCPPSVPWASTSAVPVLREAGPLASFYPISEQDVGLEGTVVLAIHIDATGCVTALAVEASSGSGAFDQAAILWEESASYQSAVSGGRPKSFTGTQPVVFSLTGR